MSLSGVWTSKGIDKLAAQTAGGPTLTIDKIALGDGGGIVPAVLPSQAALLKEVWRGLVNAVLIEPDTPNAVTVEAVIPYSVGGFYIREWGVFDTDGDLIAVGPHAEFYKPLLAEGSGAELLERIQLPLANAGQVNLTISSEALATRKYVDQTATAKAKEEVTRHDGDVKAHGGRIDTLLKRKINTTAPLAGGGDLSGDRTLTINASSMATVNYVIQRDGAGRAQVAAPAAAADIARKAEVDAVESRIPASWPLMIVTWDAAANYKRKTLVIGSNGKIYMWLRDSGPGVAGVGGKDPTAAANATYWLDYAASITPTFEKYDIAQYYWFEDELSRPGLMPCLGGIVQNISRYPKMIEYLQTTHGQKRCVTQAQYDAAHVAVWHTNADGTKVGWNGIGGVNKFVWNPQANTLRLPDLAGMSPEMIGCDSLGVGGVHGDGERRVTGTISTLKTAATFVPAFGGALYATYYADEYGGSLASGDGNVQIHIDTGRVNPTANRFQPRAWGSIACVCLDPAAS